MIATEITFVCRACGIEATGRQPQDGATWHYGDCEMCQRRGVPVTEPRDFVDEVLT